MNQRVYDCQRALHTPLRSSEAGTVVLVARITCVLRVEGIVAVSFPNPNLIRWKFVHGLMLIPVSQAVYVCIEYLERCKPSLGRAYAIFSSQ